MRTLNKTTYLNTTKGKLKNKLKRSLILLTGTICFIQIAFGQYNPFTQITNDNKPQYNPKIYGDYVVYQDRRDGGVDNIYLYDLSTNTEIQITSDPSVNSVYPDIYGDRIVWQDDRNGDWDIYTYLISRPDLGDYPFIDFPGDQTQPAIHGETLVYVDHYGDPYSSNIYMYDMSSGNLTQLTDDSDMQQYDPDVFEQWIVWADSKNGGDIYLYDINIDKIYQLTEDPATQRNPSIGGRRVVWEDDRNGDWDIYMHHIFYDVGNVYYNYDWPIYAGPFPYQSTANQINPSIYGDYIVFQDDRDGNWDIYIYSFFNRIYGHVAPLVIEDRDQINPFMSDDRVVWQDERDWNGLTAYEADIWMWERPPGADLSLMIVDDPDPIATGGELTYTLYVSNFGPLDATNVVVTDYFSNSVNFLSASSAKSGGCPRSGNTVTCSIGDLNSGDSDTITIKVKTLAEGKITNSAEVSATEDDFVPENNSASIKTTVKWQLSHMIGSGGVPYLTIDSHGSAHVVYLSNSWAGDLIYATNKSGVWRSEFLINTDDVNSAAVATDQYDSVYIAYGQGQGYDNAVKYIKGVFDYWSPPHTIKSNAGESYNICTRIDSDDQIHISYMSSQWSGADLDYLIQNGNSWSSTTINTDAYNSGSFDLDNDDFAHFSYYSLGMNQGASYRTNRPTGTWQTRELIETDWNGGQMEFIHLDIAVDHVNVPHVSYVGAVQEFGNEDTKYAYKSAGVWTDMIVEDGSFASGSNAIATDIYTNPHICYYHVPSGDFHYASNSTGNWKINTVEYDINTMGRTDISCDHLGYVHMVYVKNDYVYYVTNTPRPEYPKISINPAQIDFHSYVVGDTTNTEMVTIKNIGEANLIFSEIKLVWSDSSNFSIFSNNCDVLAPDESCEVQVAFNPESMGNKTTLLWVESNDPDDPVSSVKLTGEGLEPFMFVTGSTLFGEVVLGDSVIHDFVIENRGNYYMIVQMAKIQEDDESDFYFLGMPETPFRVEKGESSSFSIVFKPTTLGEKTSRFKLFTTDLDLNWELEGKGVLQTYSITGEIYTPANEPVNTSRARLYRKIEEGLHDASVYQDLTDTNMYQFNNLEEGEYTIHIEPDNSVYSGVVATFLGGVFYLQEATYLFLDQDYANQDIILLANPPPPGGNSDISGEFVEEDSEGGGRVSLSSGINGNGSPVVDVPVYLVEKSSKDLIAYDVTDDNGEFEFMDLLSGSYEFFTAYKGLPMDENNEDVIVSEENEELKITAIANDNQISVEILKITGLEDISAGNMFQMYPNPATHYLAIQVNKYRTPKKLHALITSMDGQTKQEHVIKLGPDHSLEMIDIKNLNPGIFLIHLVGDGFYYTNKFIKLE